MGRFQVLSTPVLFESENVIVIEQLLITITENVIVTNNKKEQ